MSGTGAVSSCDNQPPENKEKDIRTSVVFRSTHSSGDNGHHTDLLMENGDNLYTYSKDRFIEPGDTVTYEKGEAYEGRAPCRIKAVRYKDNGNPEVKDVKKKVDFGKIGKIEKDR